MTAQNTIDPIVEILLERNLSKKDQPHDAGKATIETLRSIPFANFDYTNIILELVAGLDDDRYRPNWSAKHHAQHA